ncbi:hypothetical protein EV702DRAFT_1069709 [Suillus placidus]|uniref:Uncharacterized protein n=1 Tax=Suillus placidus TaxID=48579 RepID=A0A9P7A619_9AGAM|nr:hypothetical protein EV702DRAFT_1069709 [Suillus placidus]
MRSCLLAAALVWMPDTLAQKGIFAELSFAVLVCCLVLVDDACLASHMSDEYSGLDHNLLEYYCHGNISRLNTERY